MNAPAINRILTAARIIVPADVRIARQYMNDLLDAGKSLPTPNELRHELGMPVTVCGRRVVDPLERLYRASQGKGA